jgi:uncharacterized Zn finger protein
LPGENLARRLMRLIESKTPSQQLSEGLEYARSGQLVSIEFTAGTIRGQVQGTALRPYAAQWRLPSFDAAQWARVIEAMAGEAMHVAKLLANELPPMDDVLRALDVSLLPRTDEAIHSSCTCPAGTSAQNRPTEAEAPVCKHAAALGLLASEQLARDPLLILDLLGISLDELIERLKRAREIQSRGVAGTHSQSILSESQQLVPPLEAMIDHFWRSPVRLDSGNDEQEPRRPHHVPHALLRRLGPSPMNGRFPLVGLLASVYDAVAAAATRLRDEDEK